LVVADDQGHLIGLLTERDVVTGMSTNGKRIFDVAVREVMSTRVPTCRPHESVVQIMRTMTERRSRHLPVVDDENRPVGVISLGDVVKARLDDVALENKVLRDMTRIHEE
jgi:CBS domain-containing protein